MKIYEIRDISNDEMYFLQGYFDSKENAIKQITEKDSYTIPDEIEDFVRLAVYEHELNKFGDGKKIIEVVFLKDWERDSENEDDDWDMKIVFSEVDNEG